MPSTASTTVPPPAPTGPTTSQPSIAPIPQIPEITEVQSLRSPGVASRPDLDLDFIVVQLRGTFEAKLDQLLALRVDDPACATHAAALDAINAALARVHDGTYGTCDRCDRPISAARLEVVPTTTTCVPCNAGS